MAADVALLDEVAAGASPALRLYRWRTPAVSLGRFQPDDDVDDEGCARLGVDVVRRPTGGKAILHGSDLTYAVAMPRPGGAAGSVDGVYCTVAGALVAGLGRLGVQAAIARGDAGAARGPACFTSMQGADLRVGNRKVCGSAQVRRGGSVPERPRGAVLQHGSLLLDRLPFDETAVLRCNGDTAAELRRSTVTLRELGVAPDYRATASALVEAFAATLDVHFR
jgi:lipoate-protein ligase A